MGNLSLGRGRERHESASEGKVHAWGTGGERQVSSAMNKGHKSRYVTTEKVSFLSSNLPVLACQLSEPVREGNTCLHRISFFREGLASPPTLWLVGGR